MPYVVDVNDPTQPANPRDAGQAAEELRKIKEKLMAYTVADNGTVTFRNSPFVFLGRVSFAGAIRPRTSIVADPAQPDEFVVRAELTALSSSVDTKLKEVTTEVENALEALGPTAAGIAQVTGRTTNGACVLSGRKGLISSVTRIEQGLYRVTLSAAKSPKILVGTSVSNSHHSKTLAISSENETSTTVDVLILGHTGGGSGVQRDPTAFNLLLF